MTTIRLFRNANAGDSGGTTLADLDKVQPGTGDKTLADLDAAQQQQQSAQKPQQTDEEKAAARLAELKAKPAEQLTAEEKAELGKLEPPADDKDDADDEGNKDDAPEGSFWDDVDKLRGAPLKIDWSQYKDDEGQPIDPESPQGALIREQYLVKQTLDAWEKELKDTDPRGYAYLLHRQSGGSDEEFFAKKTPNLPAYESFKDSIDLQRALYRQYLVDKGVDEEIVTAQVEKAIKDGKLFDKADAIYKEVQKTHEDELKAIEEANKRAEQEYTTSVHKLTTNLTTRIKENKGLNLVIPETDKSPFTDFLKSLVRYNGEEKKFSVVLELGDDTDRIVEAAYLLYKKGDLSSLIKKEAKKETVHRLKRAVEKSKSTTKTGSAGDDNPGGAKVVTLGNI
jgi:hypothetical protein